MYLQGRYKLGEVIQTGSQANVIEAFDVRENQIVAVKIFDLKSSKGKIGYKVESSMQQIIKKEKSKPSVYICSAFDSFHVADEFGAIVMKRYETDLFYYCKSRDGITHKEIKVIFKKICLGVRALHKKNIAHLDLKPENIFMDAYGEPVIGDFGSSYYCENVKKRSFRKKQPKKTPIEIVEGLENRGTLKYSAPETLYSKNSKYNPFFADIYSLGVILHVLLTGYFPSKSKVLIDESNVNIYSLLTSMLNEVPINRPSIHEIINHKWLQSRGSLRSLSAKLPKFSIKVKTQYSS